MTIATQVQLRRGTAAQVAAFTGAQGEVVVDTTNNRLLVGDGTTQGCWPAASIGDLNDNVLRNGGMDVRQRGTSGTVVSGATSYTLDGWMLSTVGAAAPWSQVYCSNIAGNALRIAAASGLTALTLQQRVESTVAAEALLSTSGGLQPCTMAWVIYNNAGASVTPQVSTGYASARDNFSTVTADLAATNLQSIAAGTLGIVAYTFTPAGGLSNGYQVQLSFGGALNGSSGYVDVSRALFKATPGVATGLNYAPPPYRPRPVAVEYDLNYRYLYVLNSSGSLNLVMFGESFSTAAAFYTFSLPVPMRAAPTITPVNVTSWSIVYGNATAVAVSSLGANRFGANESVGQININASSAVLTIGQAVGLNLGSQTAQFSAEL